MTASTDHNTDPNTERGAAARTPCEPSTRGAGGQGGTRRAPLDVALSGCRRVTVGDIDSETTVANMIRQLRLRDDAASAAGRPEDLSILLIDGQPTAASQRLVSTSIRHGSRLAVATVGHAVELIASAAVVVEAVWVIGPDAGGAVSLGPGDHVVGRSCAASVSCRDRTVELHHAVIEVGPNGPVSVVQLAGLQPIGVDDAATQDRTILAFGSRLTIGMSVLELRRPPLPDHAGAGRSSMAATATTATTGTAATPIGLGSHRPDPWRFPVIRAPRALHAFEPAPIEVPRPSRSNNLFGGALAPTLIGLIGAAVMAVVFDQLMFLMFGALGALVAFGTWGAQKLGVVRSRQGAAKDYAAAVADFEAALVRQRAGYETVRRAQVPTVAIALEALRSRSPMLWSVRPGDPDAFMVAIGEGELSWQPRLNGLDRDVAAPLWTTIDHASRISQMPIATTLGPDTVTAIVGGEDAFAVARSMVLQLAVVSGPADWQLVIVTDQLSRWEGLGWLPHIEDVGRVPLIGSVAECAELLARLVGDPRHLVVVIDQPDLLAARTSVLRRLLASDRSVATIVVCSDESAMPAVVTSALILGRSSARWIADTRVTALAEVVHIAGISAPATFDAAARMACFTDPEVGVETAGLPRDVSLIELLEATVGHDPTQYSRRIATRWRAAGPDPRPSTPIGVANDGTVEIDLVDDGPHGLLAGTTGAGKSELLRSLVIGLATQSSPDHITFVLVDYKGGATFDACSSLPHVVGVVTDLDHRLAARALRSLEAELRRREHLLRDVGAIDLASYRSSGEDHPALPRLVVVIDEFAALAVQQPDFIGALLGIAQRGRSLGVHLLLATQRPNGVVNDDIRANTNLRVALRVQDRVDAVDVIGDPAAAQLPRSIPGRALMRLGADDVVMFQTARCSGETAGGTEIQALAAAICEAAAINVLSPPHRPWLPALGEDSASLAAEATLPAEAAGSVFGPSPIGVLDDPDGQRRLPLRWSPGDSHLVLVGAAGSGTTTALLALGASLARTESIPELFVIDAMGDPRMGLLGSLPGCAGVVRLHETERLLRVIATLAAEIGTRKSDTSGRGARHEIVVMVDGIGALRTELDSLDLLDAIEQLDSVITEGPSVDIALIATTTKVTAMPSGLLGQIENRWVFHLTEPLDAALVGVKPVMVPAAVPGRMIEARTGLEGQVDPVVEQLLLDLACRPVDPPPPFAHRGIGELAADIDLASLPPAENGGRGGHGVTLPIGQSFDSLHPLSLPIAAGEHVMVLGPSRSGRSTTLTTIAAAWRHTNPQGWVGSVASRRSSAREGIVFDDVASLLRSFETPAVEAVESVERLIVIDDAELVDDPTGALTALIATRGEGVTVIAAGRPDALRHAYGHWTVAARRSRLGVVMAASSDLDGDLLSICLPRRLPIPARAGLAWIVADGERHLVQIARSTTT